MEQDIINLIQETEYLSRQVAQTFIKEIAHKDMGSDQWALLQDLLKTINLKSQEAFLLAANLRRA